MDNQIKGLGEEALIKTVFERVKPELMALQVDELYQVSLDIPAGIATVLGVLPEVRALREQIVKDLPSFDVAQFDKLEDYALALSFAQANYLAATQPPDDLPGLTEEATRLRDTLQAEARALIHRGLVSDAQLAQLSGARGYKNLATDLQVLTSVMQGVWEQIQGKTPTTVEDLDRASRLSTRLLRVVGLREQGPARVAEATDLRVRAFTKLMTCYEQVRRAVAYLREPHEDADQIAPALHPGRPRRRGKDAGEETGTGGGSGETGTTVPGSATPPAGTAPGTGGAAGAGTSVTPATPASSSVAGPFV